MTVAWDLSAVEADLNLIADVLGKLNEKLTVAQAASLSAKIKEVASSVSRIASNLSGNSGPRGPVPDGAGSVTAKSVDAERASALPAITSVAVAAAPSSSRQGRRLPAPPPVTSRPSTQAATSRQSVAPPAFQMHSPLPSKAGQAPPASFVGFISPFADGAPPSVPATARATRRSSLSDGPQAASAAAFLAARLSDAAGIPTTSSRRPSLAAAILGSGPLATALTAALSPSDALLLRAEKEREAVDTAVTSAAFLILEAACVALGSASAAMYMPRNEEMVCVCGAGTLSATPPYNIKHLAANSMTHGVYSSGVAIHQKRTTLDDNDRKTSNFLMFPIPVVDVNISSVVRKPVATSGISVGSAAADASPRGAFAMSSGIPATRCHGVIQFADKCRGAAPFTDADETTCYLVSLVLGSMLSRYPNVSWHAKWFDPVALHRVAPFVAPSLIRGSINVSGRAGTREPAAVGISEEAASVRRTSNFDLALPADLKAYVAPVGLIHRTEGPVSLTRRANLADAAGSLGAAPTLLELDSYMSNLHECWKQSIQMNVEHHSNDQAQARLMSRLREELTRTKAEVKRLTEQARLHGLSAGDYKKEYTTLKQELEAFLDRRIAFAGGEAKGRPPARGDATSSPSAL